MKNKEFLSSREISKYLDIPLRTIQKLTQCGKIKGIKVGKQWRFKKYDVERYLTFGTDFSKEPTRKPINFIERRTYPRINSNFKCQYVINLQPHKNICNEEMIINISAGGVLFSIKDKDINKVEIGDPVDLDFNLDNKTDVLSIKAEGRLIWKKNYRIGIKFRNIDEDMKNKII